MGKVGIADTKHNQSAAITASHLCLTESQCASLPNKGIIRARPRMSQNAIHCEEMWTQKEGRYDES